MHVLYLLFGILALLGGLVCWVFIIVEAFRDEIWKGVLCILCGLYFLYYAIFDFDHENKWLLVIGALGASTVAAAMFNLAAGLPT